MSIEISLTKGKVAVISDVDADLAEQKWSCYHYPHAGTKRFYDCAVRMNYSGNKLKTQRLHRIILERIVGRPLTKSDRVTPLDGNLLNCQRENIRPSTHSKRQQREYTRRDNASGYRGVYFQKNARLWHAQIHEGDTMHYLGLYASAEEAARAYDQAALELYGEHAKLNFPQHRMPPLKYRTIEQKS